MDANDVRRKWADRSGEFSPEYYAYYGPNETSEAIRRVFDERLDASASILELGCGPGRHLSHLREHGFENLHGVDINPDCFEVMADAYPDLARCGTFHAAAIEEIVEEFSPGQFDAVYSVETLQHVHPDDAWVFEAVARSASDYVVTVENEGDRSVPPEDRGVNDEEYDFPLYYRDWAAVFEPFGFEQVACEHGDRDTRRVFRRTD
ncbi:class I SAM-dependent methyltransferase [Haloferax volcanii]|uniref:Class I SAM-dependent methyltransferase n=1 Tax=Haloferax volcanii TaxID=2246 RepID=A0A6C0UYW2_HALVO|nr:class I SAM-dependent methyltransferase [Haloferax alexandrinus]NLV03545.1 methyltransferase domain-containing protein [Haloferax alexandrinus]QIB78999.1 class I SAM-dependent methyltransferase [Haloferax alexandrinus]